MGGPESTVRRAGRRAVPAYLFTATAFWGVSLGLLIVTLPFRFQQLGIPVYEYGLTVGGYAAGMLLTESFWGILAFRLGRPAPLVGIGCAVAGAIGLLGFATAFPVFLVAEVFLGAMGVYLAPLLRWVALSYAGPGSEGTGTGLWSAFFGLGLAAGVTVGPIGFVAFGFRTVAFTSILALAVAVAAAAGLPWSRVALPSRREGRPVTWVTLATRPFLLALVLVLIAFTAQTFTTNFLPYYSTILFGGTPTEAGYVLGAGRLVSLAAAFFLGRAVDRWGAGRSIPAGFVLLLLGGLGTWFSHSYAEMVAATVVFSGGVGWLSASVLPLALDAMPQDHQGTAVGVFGSMEDAGLLVGPLLFGSTWSAYGPSSIFPVVVLVAATGVGVSLWARARVLQRGRSEAPGPSTGPAGEPD